MSQTFAFGRMWYCDNQDDIAIVGTPGHQLSNCFSHIWILTAATALEFFTFDIQGSSVIQSNCNIANTGLGRNDDFGQGRVCLVLSLPASIISVAFRITILTQEVRNIKMNDILGSDMGAINGNGNIRTGFTALDIMHGNAKAYFRFLHG